MSKYFKNTLPSAIIFDLDGTLVDSALDLSATLNHLLTKNGRDNIDHFDVRQMVGQGAKALLIKGFEATGEKLSEEEICRLLPEFLRYYHDHITDKTIAFPKVTDTLRTLKEYQIPLAICTNKPLQLSIKLISELGLAEFFDVIIGGDCFEYRKPDPRHLFSTLSALNANPDKAIMVGDSVNDILAAQNAQIPSIGVTFGYTDKHISTFNPTKVIDHFEDFMKAASEISDQF